MIELLLIILRKKMIDGLLINFFKAVPKRANDTWIRKLPANKAIELNIITLKLLIADCAAKPEKATIVKGFAIVRA